MLKVGDWDTSIGASQSRMQQQHITCTRACKPCHTHVHIACGAASHSNLHQYIFWSLVSPDLEQLAFVVYYFHLCMVTNCSHCLECCFVSFCRLHSHCSAQDTCNALYSSTGLRQLHGECMHIYLNFHTYMHAYHNFHACMHAYLNSHTCMPARMCAMRI